MTHDGPFPAMMQDITCPFCQRYIGTEYDFADHLLGFHRGRWANGAMTELGVLRSINQNGNQFICWCGADMEYKFFWSHLNHCGGVESHFLACALRIQPHIAAWERDDMDLREMET